METRPIRRRRRGLLIGTVIAVAAAICLLVSALAAAMVLLAPDSSGTATFIKRQPGAVPWDGRSPVTALLIGTGTRSSAPAQSLTIVSFDPRSESVHMLSIPPNLWVSVPGFGQGTVATSYAEGGAKLALLTVESVTHVAIPYFVAAGRGPLQSLIDTLGGVPLTVTSSQRGGAHLRRMAPLSGAQALAYLRSSPGGVVTQSGMDRERQLMVALMSQALAAQNVFRIPTIVTTLGGSFDTNFPYDQVPLLAQAMAKVPLARVVGTALDRSNRAVANNLENGAGVLIPDWFHIRQVAEGLFPQPAVSAVGVEVVNGSGVTGQAAALANWLQLGGVNVTGIATATSPCPRTEIRLSTGAPASQRVLATELAALLQAPIVTQSVGRGSDKSHVTVLIGHDYQDMTQQ